MRGIFYGLVVALLFLSGVGVATGKPSYQETFTVEGKVSFGASLTPRVFCFVSLRASAPTRPLLEWSRDLFRVIAATLVVR